MNWKESTFPEAIKYAQGREIVEAKRPDGTDFDFDVIMFSDGTGIGVRSEWSGPLSNVTPDTEACSPVWSIYS